MDGGYQNLGIVCFDLTTDFGEFLKVIEKQKERAETFDDESDMGR